MKFRMKALLAAVCALLLCIGAAAAETDFALNIHSETAKTEATVKTFVDGDTVHFHVPTSVVEDGVLKARFLAINTPEITGKVEEYGKAAAAFTREKLSQATSIWIESDDANWNLDSTGDRHLVWVWYRTADDAAYHCLNIEILQNGLAKANSTANNRYGTQASAALEAGKEQKLNLYSGQPDPDFYYGDAIELTLKELRLHAEDYNGKKVAFNGIVTLNDSNSVYVEDVDEETEMLFGMTVYYGYGLSGKGLSILKPGNEVRIVGTMQYYEAGKTYQVSDLTYRMMKPKDPGNIQQLSTGHSPAYRTMDAKEFAEGTVLIDGISYSIAQTALSTSVTLDGLTVMGVHQANDSSAITLDCQAGDATVQVRLIPNANDFANAAADELLLNQSISVKGIMDLFDSTYQIKAFGLSAIAITE